MTTFAIEQHLTDIVEAKAGIEDYHWQLGDALAEGIEQFGREIMPEQAKALGRSVAYVRQHIVTAVRFPAELRAQDQSWSWHRKLGQKAKTLGVEVEALMDMALSEGWSEKDMATYGRQPSKTKLTLTRHCEECDSEVSIRADSGLAGTLVLCPVCLSANGENTRLGVLEE